MQVHGAGADSSAWLRVSGPMGELVRAFDWARTPLGPIASWPTSLRSVVSLILGSKQPMFLWWGPELIQIYNDAYVPSFGVGKHPRALGQAGKACWTEIWQIVEPQISEALGGKSSWHEDALVPIERNGRIEEVYWTYGYSPVFDDSNEIAGVLVVCNETTSQVLARQQERQARALVDQERARLLSLFKQAPAGICLLRGPRFEIDFINEQYARLVGRSDIVGKPLLTALPELRGQGFDALLQDVLTTSTVYVGREVLARLAVEGGDPASLIDVYVTFIYSPLRDANGTTEGVAVFAFDVTEQVMARRKVETLAAQLKESVEDAQRAERDRAALLAQAEHDRERAEAANRAKDDFLATASHELRTPLNAILGWARLLRSGKLDSRKAAQALETIERNAGAQVRLIEDILDGSRIVAGKLGLDARPLDLVQVASVAIDSLRPAADAKNIRLTTALGLGSGELVGDAERLQQVVWNLCNNAIKFTPSGGNVSVRLERHAVEVELSVTDDGIGIEAELLSKIFDRFVQAETSTTRRHGGLGLGLALVRHLTEAHGGTVEARSAGRGAGSSFIVRLPIGAAGANAEALPQARLPPMANTPALDLAGIHVLVVDDDQDSRDLVAALLKEHDVEVAVAGSGRDALRMLEKMRPDVLISDIAMPEFDGYALLREVRTQLGSSGACLPAIAMTAHARELDRQLARVAGFDEHLAKPIEPSTLLRAVARLAAARPRSSTTPSGWTAASEEVLANEG
jgi:signal transduction histidine kinase/ActR/RegA family two-component response regulator